MTARAGDVTEDFPCGYSCTAAAHNCDDLDEVAIAPGGEANVESPEEVLE